MAARPRHDGNEETDDEIERDSGRDGLLQSSDEGLPWPVRLTRTSTFHTVVVCGILTNTCILIRQADSPHWWFPHGCVEARMEGNNGVCLSVWRQLDRFFLLFFSVELMIRILAKRSFYNFLMHDIEKNWNRFDLTVVVLNAVDDLSVVAFEGVGGKHKHVELITYLRAVRVLRVMRLLRHFAKLRILVTGLVESVRFVFWTVVLAVSIIFVFAILCTQMMGHMSGVYHDSENDERIHFYFGTVERSMFTLYQFLTLDDWRSVVQLVNRGVPIMTPILFSYVIFMSFIVVSLFTGSMVNHMNQFKNKSGQKKIFSIDQEFIRAMTHAFPQGQISRQEFLELFSHAALRRAVYIDDIVLSKEESIELFDFFDSDHSGLVDVDEFVQSISDYRDGLTVKSVLRCKSNFMHILRDLTDAVHKKAAYLSLHESAWKAPPHVQGILEESVKKVAILEDCMTEFEQKIDVIEEIVQRLYGHRGTSPTTFAERIASLPNLRGVLDLRSKGL